MYCKAAHLVFGGGGGEVACCVKYEYTLALHLRSKRNRITPDL